MAEKAKTQTKIAPERMEVVAKAISCLLAGSLFAILLLTLPLNLLAKILMIVLGIALLIIAAILLISTYKETWRTNTIKIVGWVNVILFFAALISLTSTMGNSITLLHSLNLGPLATVYIIYITICLFLVLVAEVLAVITTYRKYGWRAWAGKPANPSRRKKGEN